MTIPFNDLHFIAREMRAELLEASRRVLDSGWYVLGPEVEAFESSLAAYVGTRHAVGVANGTDAIELAIRAAGIGKGDEVITASHTAVPTVCAVERSGATPVLVDIDPLSYTIDPRAVAAAVTARTRAVLPVHLYGQAADMTALRALADRHKLLLIEDCAQAIGARHAGRMVGTIGDLAAFSFYPTKNLGACGDAGAVVTNDSAFADRLRRLRNYGQVAKYHHAERGMNSRLDEIQAAILRVGLQHLDEHNATRLNLARHYSAKLSGVQLPQTAASNDHVFHLYVIRHPERDSLIASLATAGIGTLIHYPVPVHRQPAYADLGYAKGSLPVTESVCSEIVSLPLYVGLEPSDVDTVCAATASWLCGRPARATMPQFRAEPSDRE